MVVSRVLNEEFVIERNAGWEEILETLVRKITGAQQGNVLAGVNFENDLFKMKMHVFGQCGCVYGESYKEFSKSHTHSIECFHTNWQEIQDAFKSHPKYHTSLILKTERMNMERQLCQKYRIPYKGGGEYIENMCTCSFQKQWKELDIEHEESCDKTSPNFIHKPTDYKIWWHKKFFRNAHSNYRIESGEFKKIIKECTKSLNPRTF